MPMSQFQLSVVGKLGCENNANKIEADCKGELGRRTKLLPLQGGENDCGQRYGERRIRSTVISNQGSQRQRPVNLKLAMMRKK